MGRLDIPNELERALMLEAGYRCAVPICRMAHPLHIDHIDDYAKVLRHEFSNMIVLCANCHGLKGEGPRRLDRKALRQLKASLSIVNGRYNDIERRILEHFIDSGPDTYIALPGAEILYGYLVKDAVIVPDDRAQASLSVAGLTGVNDHFITRGYRLTDYGRQLVARLVENQPIDLQGQTAPL